MREAGYSERKELERILSKNVNIESERKKINDFYLALKTEQAQLTLLQNEAEGKSYDKDTHESMMNSLSHDKNELSRLNETSGALSKELKDTETKLERKKELGKDLEQLEKRGANLDVMLNLFRGSGFVNYVSTQYLRNLIQAANERFMKLTNNQFHLVLKETADKSDNTFEVCDHLNGGKLRHVKTLSGGQTFQASLSLALALSENISIFNKAKLNFFFLDEGFGTLDRDSLHIVFDTLKSLRKENRIVGVISHVEDLQQEIENFIVAKIHPERGTLLTASWE
jgi:exonuclease SbcC